MVDAEPEAVTNVPPRYPDVAREKGVDGMVIVAALVCEHGHVIETRIASSIPLLDSASRDAVDGWTFKPATQAGRNVSYWVKVPVRFSLH
jgi:periplasmic protein TonB